MTGARNFSVSPASPAAADRAFEAAFRTSLLRNFHDASGKLLALAEALATAKQGMQFIREVLAKVPAVELLPAVNVCGRPAPKLRVAFLPADHAHEHPGQLIAYARLSRIVPPWSK